jgi:hypothetical protein
MVLLFVPLMSCALLSTLAYSPLLSSDKSFRIVCFHRSSSNAKFLHSYSMFSPSASCCTACVLWRLLTSVRSACPLEQGYEVHFAFVQISPGKNAIFLSIYLLHLLTYAFGSKDFDLLCSLIQRTLAFYEVRVPQAGDLPLASFRFHLAMDTLALSYGYYCLHHSGLEP